MKNIHLIPTDKPSMLGYLTKKGKDVFNDLRLFNMLMPNIGDSENQNIYITSDEEIKDVRPNKGKWQLEKGNILNKLPTYLTDLSECKLVIMTTDQDLINDGVQAIPDEFLEWFVKNPSCEFVEVEKESHIEIEEVSYEGDFQNVEYISYKIITPQGSGAKPKYNEQTKTVAFRCPVSKVDEIALYEKFLDEFTDKDGLMKPCNSDAIFNWFGWKLWRSKQ